MAPENLQVTPDDVDILKQSDGKISQLLHGESRRNAAIEVQRIERGHSSRNLLKNEGKLDGGNGSKQA